MRSRASIIAVWFAIGSASAFVSPPSFAASISNNIKSIDNNNHHNSIVVRPSVHSALPAAVVLSASRANGEDVSESFIRTPLTIAASMWGTGAMMYVLTEALRHNLRSALEPLRAGGAFFTPLQWFAYAATVVIFAYGQGHKCMQGKLAPLVVKRACILGAADQSQNTALNVLLAPLYSAGLISATKSRLIKSHSLIWGTAILQVALQRGLVVRNGGPLLNILNGGFAAGFAWGVISLFWQYTCSMLSGETPAIDAGLLK